MIVLIPSFTDLSMIASMLAACKPVPPVQSTTTQNDTTITTKPDDPYIPPTCNVHVDTDENYLCDNCGVELEKSENPPVDDNSSEPDRIASRFAESRVPSFIVSVTQL